MSSASPFLVCIDEYGSYAAQDDEETRLKRWLRGIDGIPNATFLVEDGKVFVFEKLVRLARFAWYSGALSFDGSKGCAEDALKLLPQSWVTPIEAVEVWKIVPQPYELKEIDGRLRIWHSVFDAYVPVEMPSLERQTQAIASVLAGEIIWGIGHFSYRKQPLVLVNPHRFHRLPALPVCDWANPFQREAEAASGVVPFHMGFPALDRERYESISALRCEWQLDLEKLRDSITVRAHRLWGLIPSLPFHEVFGSEGALSEYDLGRVERTRSIYPEFGMMSDSGLCQLMDMIDDDPEFVLSTAREVRVAKWALERLSASMYDTPTVRYFGYRGDFLAHALLTGKSWSEACAYSDDMQALNAEILSLCEAAGSIMQWMAQDAADPRQRGPKISAGLYEHSRSLSSPAVVVAQTFGDFARKLSGP